MYLRNWEHNATTGLPVSGATVEVRAASLVSPNTGTVLASTTTDANGMWEFPALADAAADVKITYNGNVWWHKGMTKHSVDSIFYVTPTPRTDQFLRNAGFETAVAAGPWTVTNVQQTVLDSWQALNGAGSSATISRELTIKAPDSDASAKIVQSRVSGSLTLFQRYPIPAVFRGKTVTVSWQVRQGVAASTRAYIADSAGTTYGSTSATTGSFITLTATRTIDAAATFVEMGVSVDVSDTVYVDDSIANLGSVASTYQPEYWFPGAVTDDMIGTRTPDASVAAASGAQGLGTLFSMIANRIKAVGGTTNWYDAPATTLQAVNAAITSINSSISTLTTSVASKVAKAGDTLTGSLSFGAAGIGITWPSGAVIAVDVTPVRLRFTAPTGNTFIFTDPGVTTAILTFSNTTISWMGQALIHAGNIGSQSVAFATNATNATSAVTASSAAAATNAVDSSNLGGVGSAGYARRAQGTYTGTGVTHAISVGFQAQFLVINDLTSRVSFLSIGASGGTVSLNGGSNGSPGGVHIDGGTTFTVGANTAEANQSGSSYAWTAYS